MSWIFSESYYRQIQENGVRIGDRLMMRYLCFGRMLVCCNLMGGIGKNDSNAIKPAPMLPHEGAIAGAIYILPDADFDTVLVKLYQEGEDSSVCGLMKLKGEPGSFLFYNLRPAIYHMLSLTRPRVSQSFFPAIKEIIVVHDSISVIDPAVSPIGRYVFPDTIYPSPTERGTLTWKLTGYRLVLSQGNFGKYTTKASCSEERKTKTEE